MLRQKVSTPVVESGTTQQSNCSKEKKDDSRYHATMGVIELAVEESNKLTLGIRQKVKLKVLARRWIGHEDKFCEKGRI